MPIPWTVQVTAPIAPTSALDTYATHEDIYWKGWLMTVADITARDAITTERRKAWMVVYVVADNTHYKLASDLTTRSVFGWWAWWWDFYADGSVPMTWNLNLDGNNLNNTNIANFDITPVSIPTLEWAVYWDATNHCLAYQTDINWVVNQIWQEQHVRVLNNTWWLLANWSVVYINSADGSWVATVAIAKANSYDTSRVIWVVTANIVDSAYWIVTLIWNVNDIDTSTFVNWDTLYLADNWWLTKTAPIWWNFVVRVWTVTKVNATTWRIFVFPIASQYTAETLQSLWWANDTWEPTLSFVDWTRTLTISPVSTQFHFYQNGIKYEKTTDSYVIPDTEWLFFVYYNNWTLTHVLNPNPWQVDSIIRNNPTVAYIYWNAVDKKAEYIGKETHDFRYPPLVHSYNHFLFGMRYLNWLALNTFSADWTWDLAANAQFWVDAWATTDEDLYNAVSAITSTTWLPIAYLTWPQASPVLRTTTNAWFSVLTTWTWRLAYNQNNAWTYQLTEAPNWNFVNYHIIVVNENSPTKRVISFMWQVTYTTVANARAWATTEILNLRTVWILPQEAKAIWTVIFETNNIFTNAVKARIRTISTWVNYEDWRTTYFNWSSWSVGWWWITTPVFSDADFVVYDNVDNTKQFKFEASWITTWQTRTYTMPDASWTIGLLYKKTTSAMSWTSLVVTDADVTTTSWIVWVASAATNWFIQVTTAAWSLTFTSTVSETVSFTYYIIK